MKTLVLSLIGLKNITQRENIFSFIFGEQKIEINTIFAEFISPFVSRLHLCDPTIESIEFPIQLKINTTLADFFTEDIFSLLKSLSTGSIITIDKTQSHKLQLLSIFLSNNELFSKLNDLYPFSDDDNILCEILNVIQIIESQAKTNKNCKIDVDIDITELINGISSRIEKIDRNVLKKLPTQFFYRIITNDNLQVQSEDTVYDLINYFFEGEKENQSLTSFLEQIKMKKLSDKKFKELVLNLNFNSMTATLWENICDCFFNKNFEEKVSNKASQFLFDGSEVNQFNGIIKHLTKEANGNIHDKGIVSVTSSSVRRYQAKNVVDLDDKSTDSRLLTEDEEGSWFQIDFKNRKIRPTHYSVRSIPWDQNSIHPQTWKIEGSNDGENWKTLDSQENVSYLRGVSLAHTFEIKEKQNEFYQFVRFKQTGKNTRNNNLLSISAIEYFGQLL